MKPTKVSIALSLLVLGCHPEVDDDPGTADTQDDTTETNEPGADSSDVDAEGPPEDEGGGSTGSADEDEGGSRTDAGSTTGQPGDDSDQEDTGGSDDSADTAVEPACHDDVFEPNDVIADYAAFPPAPHDTAHSCEMNHDWFWVPPIPNLHRSTIQLKAEGAPGDFANLVLDLHCEADLCVSEDAVAEKKEIYIGDCNCDPALDMYLLVRPDEDYPNPEAGTEYVLMIL